MLCELVEEVGRVGSYVRISCNKSEILSQFSNIRSVTTCKTIWNGSLISLSFHQKISPGLEPISAEENTDDTEKFFTASYPCQVKTKVDILKVNGGVNAEVQTCGYTYVQYHDALDIIIIEVIVTMFCIGASSAQNI